jgi:uncharacterized membrane protein
MKTLLIVHVLVGALLFAIPNLTRRQLLFAVPVPPDFRRSSPGRHAITMFRLVVGAAVLAGLGVFLVSPLGLMSFLEPLVVLGTLGVTMFAFYWQYRALAPFAVTHAGPRQAALTTAPERLPWFTWLGACPFAILAAAALYLYLNWGRIPARFPVHFGVQGPDRWAGRTNKGVYGILLFAAELSAYLLIMTLASWFGARRSNSRTAMFAGLIAINNVVAAMFAAISLQPLFHLPDWAIVLGIIAAVILVLLAVVKKMNEPGESPDPTPQECWKAGVFYFNPNDAVLFVEKRGGFGYTLNFANLWSWILLAGLILIVASAGAIVA